MDSLRFILYYYIVDSISLSAKYNCIIPTDTTIIFSIVFWLLKTKNKKIIDWIISSFLTGTIINIKNMYCDNITNEIYSLSFGVVYSLMFDWIEIELIN